jgi:hypothetical protein
MSDEQQKIKDDMVKQPTQHPDPRMHLELQDVWRDPEGPKKIPPLVRTSS